MVPRLYCVTSTQNVAPRGMKKIILYHAKKHPSLATVLLVASAVLFVGICGYIFLRPILNSAEHSQTVAMTPHDLAVRNNSVSYPLFKGQKTNELIRSYATKQSEDFIAKLKNANDVNSRNRFVLDYVVLHQGSRLATVQFTAQKQYADQPTIISHHLMTINLEAQREVSFTDMFKPDVNIQERMGALLYDYFKQDHAAAFTPGQLFALFQFKPEMIHDFWMSDTAVGFSFNPWQPGSIDGQKHITINKSVLADVLTPEYAAVDPGKDLAVTADFVVTTPPKPGDTIDPNQKMLALTFDDGPGNYTGRVLDVLRQYRAHGTFFMIGRQVPGRADVVKRVVDEGNEIGNHSWDHASLPTLDQSRLQQEIIDTQNVIRSATGGYTPMLMRPPYGAITPGVANYLHTQGLKEALWNADTQDWMHTGDSQTVYDAIMGSAGDGRVVLLHDIHPSSVEAVERAIPELVRQGYQLVTMSQLERYR